jgi:DNA helicase II / ATP-dependent DNA helicase PcrA
VTIAPAIAQHYPGLNEAQRAIVGHLDGPLLMIAGPGSGKTYSIVLRALNLLLLEKAQPRQLVLCTFTEIRSSTGSTFSPGKDQRCCRLC